MARLLFLIVASLAIAIWLLVSLFSPPDQADSQRPGKPAVAIPAAPLLIYCAASNRAVMEAIAEDYETEFGVPIEFQFGPSQTLLSSIVVSGTGDLYLPADASYLDTAADQGVVDEVTPLARMHVVLGVAKGNPLKVHHFDDLLKEGVRIVQANPEVAAVGKLTREALTQQGKWEELKKQTAAFVSSVTEAANSVKVGAADVSIVYDAILTTYPDLDPVQIDEFRETFAEVKIGVVKNSSQQELARHFVEYLSSGEGGLKRYAEFGFTVVEPAGRRDKSIR